MFWDNAGFVRGNTLENDISWFSLSAHVHRGKRLDAAKKTGKVSQRCGVSTRLILHPLKLPPEVFGFWSASLCNLSAKQRGKV